MIVLWFILAWLLVVVITAVVALAVLSLIVIDKDRKMRKRYSSGKKSQL